MLAIYHDGIDTDNATFETDAPPRNVFCAKWRPDFRLVAIDETGVVFGWTAAGRVSERCVYGGVAEHAVYVDPAHQALDRDGACWKRSSFGAKWASVWTLQSGVFPENTASLALHERCGFWVVGTRQRVGCRFGR